MKETERILRVKKTHEEVFYYIQKNPIINKETKALIRASLEISE